MSKTLTSIQSSEQHTIVGPEQLHTGVIELKAAMLKAVEKARSGKEIPGITVNLSKFLLTKTTTLRMVATGKAGDNMNVIITFQTAETQTRLGNQDIKYPITLDVTLPKMDKSDRDPTTIFKLSLMDEERDIFPTRNNPQIHTRSVGKGTEVVFPSMRLEMPNNQFEDSDYSAALNCVVEVQDSLNDLLGESEN